ncbi:retropepsin-like aspartic protease [Clostridium sp. ZBS15]|uniref:retropepsin-like aspartic protease n=1 Tax=Clostridium sp. ZBS15 TaxID=2949969 RepID=UPI00207AFE37|nr:retropepsin-like aspartic protease [Clostridium sp. ZBS15]
MKLRYEYGLLFTDIKIEYNGKIVKVNDVVVDTGAAHTIIDPDVVHEAGIKAEGGDKFITMYGVGGEHYAYRKNIDCIEIGDGKLNDVSLDFGIIDEDGIINGLLGLDVLMKLGIKINLDKLELE